MLSESNLSSTQERPLVTVIIPTRNRPVDLSQTLRKLLEQAYPFLEVIVIDDASDPPLESLVKSTWPEARYIRQNECKGQCTARNIALKAAKGKYIISLDDDSCVTSPMDIASAVEFLEKRPEVGIVTFFIYNGKELPQGLQPTGMERYCVSFLAGACAMRTEAVRAAGGYVEFFENHWEEEELSLRMIKTGWAIYYFPQVMVHHRVSWTSRKPGRTWMRGLRNSMWAQVMHLPLSRLPVECAWKTLMGLRDGIAYAMPHRFIMALLLFAGGLPRAIRLRESMNELAMRRYDLLRFGKVGTYEEFANPKSITLSDLWKWWREVWWHRPRARAFWDFRKGDLGRSAVSGYEHNER